MGVKLFDGDLTKLVLEKYRVQNLKIGPCKVTLEVQDSKLIGVISFRDVAKAVLEEQDFENKMLKGYIKNWPA